MSIFNQQTRIHLPWGGSAGTLENLKVFSLYFCLFFSYREGSVLSFLQNWIPYTPGCFVPSWNWPKALEKRSKILKRFRQTDLRHQVIRNAYLKWNKAWLLIMIKKHKLTDLFTHGLIFSDIRWPTVQRSKHLNFEQCQFKI